MSGIYTQNNSPYYWIRYYDKFEEDARKKRKSLNTKIPVTEADKKRIAEAKKKNEKFQLVGTPELKKLKREFEQGLAEWAITKNSGIKLIKTLKLSEGFEEFKKAKTVPERKGSIKQSTIDNYCIAVDHFIQCCGDKYIYLYKESDYVKLLYYFEERKRKGKAVKDKNGQIIGHEEKEMSINSRAIYTRSLHAIWKFFVEKFYTSQNIIEVIEGEDKEPAPIPVDEMFIIMDYLKDADKMGFKKHHYWIIYFMLLTGVRPSSAIVQLKEDIDFKQKIIRINNVKTGSRKGKNFYNFPLYKELERLLSEEMGVKPEDEGRLFEQFAVVPGHYTWPLSFWKRAINHLFVGKVIREKYTLKQIRPTLASYLINVYGMDIYDVQRLLDHADIKITNKHYVNYNTSRVRKKLNYVTYESFLTGEFE